MAFTAGKLSESVVRVEDAMALVSTPLDHARIHRGEIWCHSAITSALNDGQAYVMHLKVGAVNELHLTFEGYGSGAGFVQLYEAPTLTVDGTGITMVNRMRITANQIAKVSGLYHTPTTSANGTLLKQAAFGTGKTSGGMVREEEWVLKPSTSYLLILESDSASNIMGANVAIYEK